MKVRPGYGLEPLPTFTCTKYNQDRAGQISTQSAGTVWKEPVAVVTAKCNSDTSPPDVYMGEPAGSCLADDAANARGILKKNFFKDCSRLQQLGVTAFRAASGSVKEYLYVYDFGAEDTVQALELVGWSSGHWAEDGLNGDTAEFPHNDNVFKIAVSTTTPDQSVSCPQVQTPAGAEQREPCNRLDDGCSWTFSVPIKLRYLTLCVSSECNGCENYDFLSAIRVKTEVDNDNNNEPELPPALSRIHFPSEATIALSGGLKPLNGARTYAGAPDDQWHGLGTGGTITYDLQQDAVWLADGPGDDFVIYEQDGGSPEPEHMNVLVSQDGQTYANVDSTIRCGNAVPSFEGDASHSNPSYKYGYDLRGTGFPYVRSIRIIGTSGGVGGVGTTFEGAEPDAIGLRYATPATTTPTTTTPTTIPPTTTLPIATPPTTTLPIATPPTTTVSTTTSSTTVLPPLPSPPPSNPQREDAGKNVHPAGGNSTMDNDDSSNANKNPKIAAGVITPIVLLCAAVLGAKYFCQEQKRRPRRPSRKEQAELALEEARRNTFAMETNPAFVGGSNRSTYQPPLPPPAVYATVADVVEGGANAKATEYLELDGAAALYAGSAEPGGGGSASAYAVPTESGALYTTAARSTVAPMDTGGAGGKKMYENINSAGMYENISSA